MPQITISAQLIRITRTVQPGQWLLIHPDEHYEVLTHEQALALQGRKPRNHSPATAIVVPGRAPVTPLHGKPAKSQVFQLNGKTITVEPQRLAILQYMDTHGTLTVAEASTLLGSRTMTTVMSVLKNLGLVTSQPVTSGTNSPHIYTITNDGRTVARGGPPAAE